MANLPNEIVGEIFTVPPEERIQERTISFHAINPFAYTDSSSRLYMASSHISQSLVLCHGEERIIQSGLDHQFGENTFSVKIEEDCYVLGVVPRYKTLNSDDDVVEIFIFVETVSGKYDVYNIPHYFSLHQYFGFEYIKDKKQLLSLPAGTFLKEGTVLADSPSVHENSGLALGVNANICLTNLPPTAQDGVVISESLAHRLSYKTFETRTIEFGSNKFLLNIYGDDENYRGFPELGELINQDSMLAALRETDEKMSLCLTSKEDLKHYDVDLDHCVYVNSPGSVIENKFGQFKTGKIVDIKAWCNQKAKKNNLYVNTLGTTMDHVAKLKYFYQDVWEFYRGVIKEKSNGSNKREDGSLNLSPRLHSLIFESMVHCDVEQDKKILLSNRYTPLDVFRIEFTIENYITPTTGWKISDYNGSKSVILRPIQLTY